MEPHLVNAILDSNNNVVRDISPKVIRENFIDADNNKIVREGMRQTVLAGSARSLQTVPVAAAGKTGTAQWSSKKAPHAWFTGFAPYDNPQVVITVMVEEGREGSSVSVPIAKEILQWYFGGRDTVPIPIIAQPVSTSTEVYLD
jgi:penicillin-binding protein 2